MLKALGHVFRSRQVFGCLRMDLGGDDELITTTVVYHRRSGQVRSTELHWTVLLTALTSVGLQWRHFYMSGLARAKWVK